MRITPTTLRLLLLSSMGVPLVACGGTSSDGPSDDSSGGQTSTDGGAGTTTGGKGSGGSTPGGGGSGAGTGTGGSGSAQGTGASAGDGGAGNSGGTGALGGGGSPPASGDGCTDPEPLLPEADTGFYLCQEGYLRRTKEVLCPTDLPRPETYDWPYPEGPLEPTDGTAGAGGTSSETIIEYGTDDCSSDRDCPENAYCVLSYQSNQPAPNTCANVLPEEVDPIIHTYQRTCIQGCRQDGDCADNQVCVCRHPVGYCKGISPIAGCHSDADCGAGLMCLQNAQEGDPLFSSAPTFACQLPGDECSTAQDCNGGVEYCQINESGRTCQSGAVCGRPFLVLDLVRLAPLREGATWRGDARELPSPALPERQQDRHRLADHWAQIALMEHASVAAFARFTLQLLSLGAPADLVEQATRAQADEARHARIGFHLASHYAGRAIAPGPLDLSGALEELSFEQILTTTVREACIGETRASLEVARAAELAADPQLRTSLSEIAEDEARHAELGWKVVAWMLSERPELMGLVMAEIRRAGIHDVSAHQAEERPDAADGGLAAHGLLGDRASQRCRSQADREVIWPCALGLLSHWSELETKESAATPSVSLES